MWNLKILIKLQARLISNFRVKQCVFVLNNKKMHFGKFAAFSIFFMPIMRKMLRGIFGILGVFHFNSVQEWSDLKKKTQIGWLVIYLVK